MTIFAGSRYFLEEYVFAISHVFFHKAWMKNEILERINEKKRNHLQSSAHFSQFTGQFSLEEAQL